MLFCSMFVWIVVFFGFGFLPNPWDMYCQLGWGSLLGVTFLILVGIALKGTWDDLVIINGKKYENFTSCDTCEEAEQCASYIRNKEHDAEFISEDWEGKRHFRVYVRYAKGKQRVYPCHYYEHFRIDPFGSMEELAEVKKRNIRRDAMTIGDIKKLIKSVEGDICVHCGADFKPKDWWGSRIGLFEPKLRYKPKYYSQGGCFPVGPWCCDEQWEDWIIFNELIDQKKITKSQLSLNQWKDDVLDLLFR